MKGLAMRTLFSLAAIMMAVPATAMGQPADSAVEERQLARTIAVIRFNPEQLASDFAAGFDLALGEQLATFSKQAASLPEVQRREVQRRIAQAKAIGHTEALRFSRSEIAPSVIAITADGYQQAFDLDDLRESAAFWASPAGQLAKSRAEAAVRGKMTTKAFANFSDMPAVQSYFSSRLGEREEAVADTAGPRIAALLQSGMERLHKLVEPKLNAALTGKLAP